MSQKEQDTIRQLELELKKLNRALAKERALNERNHANFEAKRQFSEIVLAERSRLERNMKLMLRHSTNMLLFFDVDGIIDFCAEIFLAFRGIAGFGLIKGGSFRDITQAFLPADFIESVEGLLADPITLNESDEPIGIAREANFQAFSNIEHELRDYLVRAVLLINDMGEKDGLLIQMYDTTEYTRAARAAEQANTAKSDFLATVSHEIRTPMNAIIGLADILSTTDLNEAQREYLYKIQASSVAMLGLINDILDFSKIEADKLDILMEYFDLQALLNNMESMFEVMMAQKQLSFTTRFDPALPQVVLSDDKRVRQILTNVLNNAYKYTPSGTVSFLVEPAGDDIIRFDVVDTGIGIREEDLGSLFTEFEQLDVVRNKHITGTGLGLAITKRLVELLDGRIEVRSVYGEGSTFSILLPFKPGSTEDLPIAFDETIKFSAPGAHVLIVDDVDVNIEIAEFMLEPYEVTIEKAHNGLRAVELAREKHFDLILMDQMMPVMDGIEATHRIRELKGPAAEVPIVALTANAIQGMEAKFKEAGFDGFISKPIDTTQLARTLYRLLPKELIVE
ncbi:MAG: response regulator [Coriobacteriales bacterium]|jgi:signal transduction histidine kinase/ActR/RegA family two-component response regulator|nr:response regulator [Coriobacteriales bacterium]